MSKFETRAAVAGKIEWEGGIMEALDYGIRSGDMPDDELRDAWDKLEKAHAAMAPLVAFVEDLLDGTEGERA
jgi:hypothetical protein